MYLLIKSEDQFGNKYEKSFISQKVLLDNRIEYSYLDEHGESKIFLYENHVEIYRKGEINTKQIFKLKEMTNFLYLTKEFKKNLFLNTSFLDISEKNIYLIYDIIDESEVINTIKLKIIELEPWSWKI